MNKTIQIIIGIIVVVIILVGIWYGVSRKPTTPITTPEPTAPTTKEPIKIGVLAPLTGEAASFGQNSLAGVNLAVKEINDQGGINGRKVEIVAEDDKCSAEGVNAMNKLINVDKVIGIIGPVCSASGGPSLPIAQNSGVPAIITASAPHLTKIGDYIFRVYPSDAFQGKVAAEFMFNKLGKKKVAIVYVKNDWGEGIKEVFKSRFKELGGEIVYEGGVVQDQKDFRTEITKVKSSGVEALYFPVYPANGISAFKQFKEMALNIPVVGGDAFDGEEVIKSDYSDGIIYTVAKINIPEDFKVKINSLPGFENLQVNMMAPLGYDSAKVLFLAIEKAGVDRQKIKEILKTTSYQGISNPLIEFDENGDLKNPAFEVKIIKNKQSAPYEQ
jgi:branched-chain amino acid transport system substrate-binding protein